MSEARHTRRLADLRVEHGGTFGGKSSTLGELIAAGIPVPPGFALDTTAFHAFVAEAGLEALIASATARMSPDDIESVGAASQAIGEAMRSAPMPDAVSDEVGRRYAELAEEVGLDGRRSRSARARSARTARMRPSRGSRSPISGCVTPTTSATQCAIAG